jgi:hypothetical protein
MFDKEYEADAYDVTCRVCEGWEHKNVSPTLAAMHLMRHSEFHSVKELGEPWWAMRVVSGVRGLPDGPAHQTPDDGWNRSPSIR